MPPTSVDVRGRETGSLRPVLDAIPADAYANPTWKGRRAFLGLTASVRCRPDSGGPASRGDSGLFGPLAAPAPRLATDNSTASP